MRFDHLRLIIGVVTGCTLSGCATIKVEPDRDANPPVDLYSFSSGRGSQEFSLPPVAVRAAVYEAMEDLNMTVLHRGREGAVSQTDGRTSDGRSVTITIRPQHGMTHVGCRIGLFGDDPLSKTLMERVGIRLGPLPPDAIPDKPPSSPASNPFFSRDAVPDSVLLRDIAEAPYRNRPDL